MCRDWGRRRDGLRPAHGVTGSVVDVSFVTAAFVRECTVSMCPLAVVRSEGVDMTGKHADVQGNERDRQHNAAGKRDPTEQTVHRGQGYSSTWRSVN